jgi:hypothetical protein
MYEWHGNKFLERRYDRGVHRRLTPARPTWLTCDAIFIEISNSLPWLSCVLQSPMVVLSLDCDFLDAMKDGLFGSTLACAPPDFAVVENNGFPAHFCRRLFGHCSVMYEWHGNKFLERRYDRGVHRRLTPVRPTWLTCDADIYHPV